MSGIFLAVVGASYGAAPVNTVAPAVTGTATVGQTLSTTNGTWTGAPAPTFTYQWQRTGVDISAATSSTYVLVAADYANTIRCVVKATNSIAPSGVTANSNSTASVAGTAPVNTVAPAVTGSTVVGQTLTTTNGTWTGTPTPTFTYQWQRVTTNISAATSSTYVLVTADIGSTIRCVVTATNAISAVSANSNSTATVTAVTGQIAYIGVGTFTFVVPAGVTSVSGMAVSGGGAGGPGGGGNGGGGGAGGNVGYKNNMTVTPGASHTMIIGNGGQQGCPGKVSAPTRWFCAGATALGSIGSGAGGGNGSGNASSGNFQGCGAAAYWTGRGYGGYGGSACGCTYVGGGGGAAGYGGGTCTRNSTSGGSGGQIGGLTGANGSNGGAAGGSWRLGSGGAAYGGGAIGLLGEGTSGTASAGSAGAGGSGGTSGSGSSGGAIGGGGGGGAPGGGGSGSYTYGAIRLIWPGTTRSFPSTNTGDL